MSTLNYADVYGSPSNAGAVANATTQVSGPNPGAVTGSGQAGAVATVGGKAPAFSWVAFVASLVILRMVIDANRG